MLIQKFGGSSLADIEGFTATAGIISRAASDEKVVVVLSAMYRVTDLLENAIKYSMPGDPIRAKWSENPHGEYVFSVKDQGPGIEPEDISKLTNRYYRGRKSRAEVAGSGLGLAIVQHAANKHGATFKITSNPGKGSCFSVTFPSYRSLRDERVIDQAIRLAGYN